MRTHPVFLRLDGRACVVVGGDAAAETKVGACLDAGARVTVIAEEVTPGLRELAAAGRIGRQVRAYRPGDLRGAFLAYASVRDPATVAQLREEADREGVLLNVVDTPAACTFIAPAVMSRGDLMVAIGTGGASPGLAAELRRRLETVVGPEYETLVAILGGVRRALAGHPARAEVMAALLDSPLLDLVRRGAWPEVDALLVRLAGGECRLAALGVALGAGT